jgi:hypothetical protein
MNEFQRHVRAAVIHTLRDEARAPTAGEIAASLGASSADVSAALHALAAAHRLVLEPGTDVVRMAHPFSAVPTDFVVTMGSRHWYANCVWDGLAILALFGDGVVDTQSPATRAPIRLQVSAGQVRGDALAHFLVPMRRLWDDIVFT